jgi:hypothetical protein
LKYEEQKNLMSQIATSSWASFLPHSQQPFKPGLEGVAVKFSFQLFHAPRAEAVAEALLQVASLCVVQFYGAALTKRDRSHLAFKRGTASWTKFLFVFYHTDKIKKQR